MSFWRRAPRSVYQVYDEEQYLAGESETAGEGELASEDHEQITVPTQVPTHGPRSVRLLALGVLAVVTVSAASIVAVAARHHSQTGPVPVVAHRGRTHPAWTTEPELPTRVSQAQPSRTPRVVLVASAPVVPKLPAHSSAVSSSRRVGMDERSVMPPSGAPMQPSSEVADAAAWPTNESSPTNESQIDDEFGFER
jgi:hypothetical protein